jgi:RNA polymerase sigma-70 factor (ECF subfamily)
VLGYLRAQGAPEPEDLTSEVFLRVFDRLPQFSGDEPNFRSWLFTIAHRILIDDARRRQRRPRTTALGLDVETRPAGDVEHEAMAKVGADWADELLASLPPDQRAVVSLRVTADLSLEQVAEILGKRVGAVKSLQHRALESLRRRCEEVPA